MTELVVTDDLRNQLAQAIASALHDAGEEDFSYINPVHLGRTKIDGNFDLTEVADALLARFAIAGPLPDPDADYEPGSDSERWSINTVGPRIYLAPNGHIDFTGCCYWNTRHGDDPRPFAAALIAAYIKAQEQHHE
jgi:hypothetical protein